MAKHGPKMSPHNALEVGQEANAAGLIAAAALAGVCRVHEAQAEQHGNSRAANAFLVSLHDLGDRLNHQGAALPAAQHRTYF